MKKRVLSLILAAVMVCAVVPTAALAAGVTVTEIVAPKYSEIGDFSEGLAKVKLDGKYGFIDTTGKEVVPCKYDAAGNFSDGLARVTLDGKYGYIDTTGKEVVPIGKYDSVGSFSEGPAKVYLNGKWGFIDKLGKEVVPCKYDEAGNFSDGLARVTLDGKYGYIDTTGKEVVPCKYDRVGEFSDGLTGVWLDGKCGVIDKTGKEVVPIGKYDGVGIFSEGFALVTKDGKRGYIDTTGKEIVPCKYDGAHTDVFHGFSEGLACVFVGEYPDIKCGFIDTTGKEVIPCTLPYFVPTPIGCFCFYNGLMGESEGGYAFYNGIARVRGGYIDKTGKNVAPPNKYDSTRGFSEGLAAVKKDGKWGFIDNTGKQVTPYYDDALSFSEGLAAVKLDGKWGFIDNTGKQVTPYYDDALSFSEGLAAVKLDGKWGVIDKLGKEVVPIGKYDSVGSFSEDLAKVKLDGKYGFIDTTGNEVVPCTLEYDWVDKLHNGFVVVRAGSLWHSKYGLLAIDGDINAPAPATPATNTAHPSTQTVDVDGKKVEFQCYALKDENGNDTNYIKLRDLADILNGSAAQFQVGWDGNITITTKTAYTKNGTEQNTPFSGQRTYEKTAIKTLVDGKETSLDTFQLKDDNGGGYTYYKLRDLGKALGITVDWSAERGIFIETK